MENPAANSSATNNDLSRSSHRYSENNKGSSSASGKDSDLLKDLSRVGLKTVDKREVGGALWIIGDKSIEATIRRVERQYKVRFNYCGNGSRSSGWKPAWWTKCKSSKSPANNSQTNEKPNIDKVSSPTSSVKSMQADSATLIDSKLGASLSDWHKTGRIVRYLDIDARTVVILRSLGCITISDLFSTYRTDYLATPGATKPQLAALEVAFNEFLSLYSSKEKKNPPTPPSTKSTNAAPTSLKQTEAIIDPKEIASLPEEHKEAPINAFLDLTPGTLRALSTIGCKAVKDLGETPADTFTEIRGISLGALGKIRREFQKRTSQPIKTRKAKPTDTGRETQPAKRFPKTNQCETIVDSETIASLPEDYRTRSIATFLSLTPKVFETLWSLNCEKVEDLAKVTIKDFVAIKGMTVGTVGKIRKEFDRKTHLHTTSLLACTAFVETEAQEGTPSASNYILDDKLASLPDGANLTARKSSLLIDETLKLPPATIKALKAIGCFTLGDLLKTDCTLLLGEKSMGPKAIQRIRGQFKEFAHEESRGRFTDVEQPQAELLPVAGDRYTICLPMPLPIELISYARATGLPDEWGKEPSLASWLDFPTNENELDHLEDPEICPVKNKQQRIDLLFHEPLSLFVSSSLKKAYGLSLGEALQFAARASSSALDRRALQNKITRQCPTPLLSIPPLWLVNAEEDCFTSATVGDLLNNPNATVEQLLLVSIAMHRYKSLADIANQADSCKQLFSQCVIDSNPKTNCRAVNVTTERNCGLQKKSLQSLADEHDITRERIRQIEQKTSKKLDLKSSLRFYLPRIIVAKAALDLGGAGSIDELVNLISSSEFPLASSISDIVNLMPEITLDKERTSFFVENLPCSSCHKLSNSAAKLIRENSSTEIAALKAALGCGNCTCSPCARWVASKFLGLSTDGSRIGPSTCPDIKKTKEPRSVRAKVLRILEDAGRALAYDDLAALYKKKYGEDVEKTRVMSHMGSSEDSLLWGRGTYIHKRYIHNPKPLIAEICNHCVRLFTINRTSILGVGGIYDLFKDQLQKEGVPNEQALYSLIRMNGDSRLKLQEYPWICDAPIIGSRTSFAKYFYSVLAANNGFITDSHAESVASRCMAQKFALGGLAEYSDYVIRANGGWYDVAAADFNMAGIAELAREIAEEMHEDDIVSTVAVFENNKERCLKYGVKSHDILYYLIDMLEDDLPIEATRKPHLTKSKHKGLSALAAMRLYINNSDEPVSSEELHEEFITKRKLKLRGICGSLIVDEETILVGSNLFWSREKLSLNTSYIEQFDQAIADKVRYAHKVAELFYPVSNVLPTLRDLPSPAGLTWNPTLLSTVFSRSGHFRLFGENGTCIVAVAENPNVTNVETFYHELLSKEFYGWSTFDE